VADTIAASAKPTLSSQKNAKDTTLTGWTKSVTQNDFIGINVDSNSGAKQVTILITMEIS
jgi:hypothetical protein